MHARLRGAFLFAKTNYLHRRLMALMRCTLPCTYPIPAPRRGVDANGEVAIVETNVEFGILMTRVIKPVCMIDAAQGARVEQDKMAW